MWPNLLGVGVGSLRARWSCVRVFSSRAKAPTLLFDSAKPLAPKLALGVGGAQLLFWANLSDLSYRHFMTETVDATGKSEYRLAPLPLRVAVSLICLATGSAVFAAAHVYASRCVRQLFLLPGSQTLVEITTHGLWGRKSWTVPAHKLLLSAPERGQHAIVLKSPERFFLLLRSGTLTDSAKFNAIFKRE
ncbi:hypothetical protein DFJ73DRAFT_821942 [Zopfochytrium polystomum]|nr:hypothetical protein DFJ73DRAFT_821942 [Zopfochytrium polystomum]